MFWNPAVTYIAASGDWADSPEWPSTSNKVLAVGGTTDMGSTDTDWVQTGGGPSLYYSAPSWQASFSKNAMRTTPDVSMPGAYVTPMAIYISPQTGQPDAACVKANGAANCGWYGFYGTSAAAPMWAGLTAVAQAEREQLGKANLQNFAGALYSVASVPGNYAMAFTDVTGGGANLYVPKAGYDFLTGLGVPKTNTLIGYLEVQ